MIPSGEGGGTAGIRWILAGIGLAILLWLADVFVDVFFFHEGTYAGQLFEPTAFEIHHRVFFVVLVFAITVYSLFNSGRLNSSIRRLNAELAERHRVEAALTEQETRFRLLVEQIPGAVYNWDLGDMGQCFYVSSRIESMLGFKVQDWLDDRSLWSKQVYPEDRERVLAAERRAEANGEPLDSEFRMVRSDGRVIWMHDQSIVTTTADGRIVNQGILMDVTERKSAEHARSEVNEDLSRSVSELAQRNREITLINGMAASFQTSLTVEDVYAAAERSCAELFSEDAGTLFKINVPLEVSEPVASWGSLPDQNVAVAFPAKDCPALRDGRTHLIEAEHPARCSPVTAGLVGPRLCIPLVAHGETIGVLSLRKADGSDLKMTEAKQHLAHTVADTTALALANLELRETLRQQAIRDSLTGLFNRRYLEETLEREVQRAKRDGQRLGVIMVDIDYFKEINDTYGHEAGDAALHELGGFLRDHVRLGDIACRYGGEEFILMLPGASLVAARARAELLREELKLLQICYEGRVLEGLTLSFGVAMYPDHGATGEAVVRAADLALYRAKHSGRNRIEIGRPDGR